jgi:DNA topoisomerase-3
MVTKVLCVAEKPSIAKAVANHLSGGNVQTVSPVTNSFALNDIDHV